MKIEYVMKPTILLLSALWLIGCCPEITTKTETNNVDSMSVNTRPLYVGITSINDTMKQSGSITVPDSVIREWRTYQTIYWKDTTQWSIVPQKETFQSNDGKRDVTIDRSGKVPIAIFHQKEDSIKILLEENTYWKWRSEIKEVTKEKSFWDGLTDIIQWTFGIVCVIGIIFVVNLIRGKR